MFKCYWLTKNYQLRSTLTLVPCATNFLQKVKAANVTLRVCLSKSLSCRKNDENLVINWIKSILRLPLESILENSSNHDWRLHALNACWSIMCTWQQLQIFHITYTLVWRKSTLIGYTLSLKQPIGSFAVWLLDLWLIYRQFQNEQEFLVIVLRREWTQTEINNVSKAKLDSCLQNRNCCQGMRLRQCKMPTCSRETRLQHLQTFFSRSLS